MKTTMDCGLCGKIAEEVEIVCNETGQRLMIPLCDDCLLDNGSYVFADFLQSKFDYYNEHCGDGLNLRH